MIPKTSSRLNTLLGFVEGDRWGGIPSITIKVNGVPYGAPVASAKLQISVTMPNAAPLITLSTGGSTIVITSAANWQLTVPSQNLVLPDGTSLGEGTYCWAFQATDQGGGVQTYMRGTFTVLPKLII